MNISNDYIQNPRKKNQPKKYDTFWHEGNPMCEESINVFIDIENNKVTNFNYSGDCSKIASGSASFFYDIIIGEDIYNILNMTYSSTLLKNNFIVSPRRKNATLLPLLAIRNAIHIYIKDGKKDNFSNIEN